MATLMFTKEFLDAFTGLEPQVRQKVRELPDKFEDAVHTGVHLEKLAAARDDRIRTVRVDQFWRGVVVRLGDARYALLRVMPHDDAIAWAKKQRFGVNPVTGLVEILDVPTVEAKVDAVVASVPPQVPSLFANCRDRDFTAVGVDEELIPLLRRIVDEAELYAIANYLPDAQSDAVLMLADGMSPQAVWAEIARDYELTSDVVDTEDIETAIKQPGSRSHFVVTTNDAELVDLLSGDFEAWRTFLHPAQRAVAYRPVYKGSAKVTGGAGTGKTVVAVHRARFLAQRLIEAGNSSGRILFATYTNSLATNLDHTLRTFCTPDEYRRLQVSTVDAFARRTLSAAKSSLKPVPSEKLREMADQAASMVGLEQFDLDGRFLIAEWEQVILARQLTSYAAYATSPRPGRGRRLSRPARKILWAALEQLLSDLHHRGQSTYVQLAEIAADLLSAQSVWPYAHVIVDEAQDLHPSQWRLLRAAVSPGENDLFIVGDANQRIYDNRVSLRSLGIETRGKSRRLKINYRTSQEILGWTLGILTGEEIDDLDGETESQIGYRSSFHGPVPTVQCFTTSGEEAEFVAAQVQEWLDEGVASSSIGITARTRQDLRAVEGALRDIKISFSEIGTDGGNTGVRISTMHSSKGLEFARLAVVAVNGDNLPHPMATTPLSEDPVQNALDILRERCLLYVAFTRARDELLVTSSGIRSALLPPSLRQFPPAGHLP
jgi:superfamily I DNA/RNA helicase